MKTSLVLQFLQNGLHLPVYQRKAHIVSCSNKQTGVQCILMQKVGGEGGETTERGSQYRKDWNGMEWKKLREESYLEQLEVTPQIRQEQHNPIFLRVVWHVNVFHNNENAIQPQ